MVLGERYTVAELRAALGLPARLRSPIMRALAAGDDMNARDPYGYAAEDALWMVGGPLPEEGDADAGADRIRSVQEDHARLLRRGDEGRPPAART
jgi:hypothetical protein